ncbi:AbrB/MazE/SpoVT family DNA-binding domain-containing protein [Patescibacteria group bacterium]
MTKIDHPAITNYGMATMGERGQVVIPKKIRDKLKIKPGDNFMVFLKGDAVVAFIKPEKFDKLIADFTGQLFKLKNIKK